MLRCIARVLCLCRLSWRLLLAMSLLIVGPMVHAAESSVSLAPQVFLPQFLKSDWRGSSFSADGHFLLVVDDSRSFILDAYEGRELRGVKLPNGHVALWSRPLPSPNVKDYLWLVSTDQGLLLRVNGKDGTAMTVASFPASKPEIKYRTEHFTFELLSPTSVLVNLSRRIETKEKDAVRVTDERNVVVLTLADDRAQVTRTMPLPSTFDNRDVYVSVNADAGYVALYSPDGDGLAIWAVGSGAKQSFDSTCFFEGEDKILGVVPLGQGFLAFDESGLAFVLNPRERHGGQCTEQSPAKLKDVRCQLRSNIFVVAGRGPSQEQFITVAKDYSVEMSRFSTEECSYAKASFGNIHQAYFSAPIYRVKDIEDQKEIRERKGFVATPLGALVLVAAGPALVRLEAGGKAPMLVQNLAGRPSGALEVEAGPGFLLASRAAAPLRVFDVSAGRLRTFNYDYQKYLDEAWFFNKPFAIASKLAAVVLLERDGNLKFLEALGSVNTAELPRAQRLAINAPNALCTSEDGRRLWILANGDVVHHYNMDPKGRYQRIATLKLGDHRDVFKIACSASGMSAVAGDSLSNSVYVFSMVGNAVKTVQRLNVPGSSDLLARPSLSPDSLILGVGPNLYSRPTASVGFKRLMVLQGAERLILNAAGDQLLAVGATTKLYRLHRDGPAVRLLALTGDLGQAVDGAFFGRFFVTMRGAESLELHGTTGEPLGSLAFGDDDRWVFTDGRGRFDTYDPEGHASAYWVMQDDPMRALDPEQFMKDYFEPRLMARLMECKLESERRPEACSEAFTPIRPVDALNRARPEVEFLAVMPDPSSSDTVTLRLRVSGLPSQASDQALRASGAYDLHVRRDGQLVSRLPLVDESGGRTIASIASSRLVEGIGAVEVSVPNVKLPHVEYAGTVEFSAYAFNDDGVKGPTRYHSYSLVGSGRVIRRAFVVAIGTSAYEDEKLDLRYPADDARLMVDEVVPALKSTKRFDEVVPILLTSEWRREGDTGRNLVRVDSKKARIRQVLEAIAGTVRDASITSSPSTPDDTVIILFSGHGLNYAQEFYLVPFDSGSKLSERAGEPVLDLKRQVSSAELSYWLRDLVAEDIVLVVDACHSSASVETPSFKPGPMGARGFGQLAYDKGMRVLASTRPDDLAWESQEKGHGLLSHALIKDGLVLRKADRLPTDGTITIGEWLQYAVDRVPALYGEVSKGLGSKDARIVSFDSDTRASREVSVNGRRVQARSQQPSIFNFRRGKDSQLAVAPPQQ